MLKVSKVDSKNGKFKVLSLDKMIEAVDEAGYDVWFSEEVVAIGSMKTHFDASATKSAMTFEGDRLFIKCTCRGLKRQDTETTTSPKDLLLEMIESTSYIELAKSDDMKPIQNCGATTTYARKYALSGLFGISEGEVDE